MATFSQDQVRQFYVVTANSTTGDHLAASDAAGTIKVKDSTEDVWFEYVTPNGDNGATVVRTDLINKAKVVRAVASPATSRRLKRLEVVLDPSLNSGDPIVGQEYILRFTLYGMGIGGQENQYIKEGGAYRVRPGDTAATIYENLAELSQLNFSRESTQYVKVTTDTYDPETATNKPGTSTKIIIEEVSQPWVLGKRQASQVNFNVNTVTVIFSGQYYPWGVVTDTTSTNPNMVNNGRMAADMEWFYIGDRADYFRGMGYPDNFETTYLANASQQYDFIDIEHYYSGNNEDIQRSNKQLTLAIPQSASGVAAALVTALTSAGITVVDNL